MKEGTGTNAAETSGHRASLPSACALAAVSLLPAPTINVAPLARHTFAQISRTVTLSCSVSVAASAVVPQRNESDRTLGEDLVRKLFECIGCNTTVALEGRDQWNMDSGPGQLES